MSTSSEIVESGRFSGQSPEKSNFSQTCNLLSHYLKEKRTLADLSLGTTTMNLFPVTDKPENAQMTIFYGGQVVVFNDFPSEKAKEIMMLASKACLADKQPPSLNVNSLVRLPHPIVSDLPIARKASLTRFLDKRKGRITGRAAPYGSGAGASATKPAETKLWLGLAAADSPVNFQHQ